MSTSQLKVSFPDPIPEQRCQADLVSFIIAECFSMRLIQYKYLFGHGTHGHTHTHMDTHTHTWTHTHTHTHTHLYFHGHRWTSEEGGM